jgi:hypothetical protein
VEKSSQTHLDYFFHFYLIAQSKRSPNLVTLAGIIIREEAAEAAIFSKSEKSRLSGHGHSQLSTFSKIGDGRQS